MPPKTSDPVEQTHWAIPIHSGVGNEALGPSFHFGTRWRRFAGYNEKVGRLTACDGKSHYQSLAEAYECHVGRMEGGSGLLERLRERAAAGARPVRLRLGSRLLVGAGLPALRTGIGLALHPLYGFVYLPAAALKSAARRGALAAIADALEIPLLDLETDQGTARLPRFWDNGPPRDLRTTSTWDLLAKWIETEPPLRQGAGPEQLLECVLEKGALPDEAKREKVRDTCRDLVRCFGTTGKRGDVEFRDGLPEDGVRLRVAIWNPHHRHYYTAPDTSLPPPADWDQPTPLFLLTVAPATVNGAAGFQAWVRAREEGDCELAVRWLAEGVAQFGLGAKTRKGYGCLEVPDGRETADPDPQPGHE